MEGECSLLKNVDQQESPIDEPGGAQFADRVKEDQEVWVSSSGLQVKDEFDAWLVEVRSKHKSV